MHPPPPVIYICLETKLPSVASPDPPGGTQALQKFALSAKQFTQCRRGASVLSFVDHSPPTPSEAFGIISPPRVRTTNPFEVFALICYTLNHPPCHLAYIRIFKVAFENIEPMVAMF